MSVDDRAAHGEARRAPAGAPGIDAILAAAEDRMREAALELSRQDEERVRELVRAEVLRFGRLVLFELSGEGWTGQRGLWRCFQQAQARYAAGHDVTVGGEPIGAGPIDGDTL